MTSEHETNIATLKIAIAWIGMVWGGITLSSVALTLTCIFTALQIYKLIRDLWWPRKP